MKKKILFMTLCVLGTALAAQTNYLKSACKNSKVGDVDVRDVHHTFLFDGSTIAYKLRTDPATGRISPVKNNYFYNFGLKLGGGWCGWNFLRIVGMDGKNIMNQSAPECASLFRFTGGAVADMVWPEVKIRMIQLNSMKNWMFIKVENHIPLKNIMLAAWPGGTAWDIPARERRLAMDAADYDLTGRAEVIPMTKNGLVLYNRNFVEDNGVMLVFNAEEYERLSGNSATRNAVNLVFTPKKEGKNHVFAFGYFSGIAPDEAMSRFFKEQMPNIEEMLFKMNWDVKPDISGEENAFAEIMKLIADTKEPPSWAAAEWPKITEAFQSAKKSGDPAALTGARERMEAFRLKFAQEKLNALK